MNDKILKKMILEVIMQEMGTKIKSGHKHPEGYNTTVSVTSSLMKIEDEMENLRKALSKIDGAEKRLVQLERIVSLIDKEYGMSKQDIDIEDSGGY